MPVNDDIHDADSTFDYRLQSLGILQDESYQRFRTLTEKKINKSLKDLDISAEEKQIMYAELNTKSDYCQVCGYTGEIQIEEDKNHKLIWKCPNCGNTDQNKMNVARRTCGYIGTQFWNQGRTQEIKERVLHL